MFFFQELLVGNVLWKSVESFSLIGCTNRPIKCIIFPFFFSFFPFAILPIWDRNLSYAPVIIYACYKENADQILFLSRKMCSKKDIDRMKFWTSSTNEYIEQFHGFNYPLFCLVDPQQILPLDVQLILVVLVWLFPSSYRWLFVFLFIESNRKRQAIGEKNTMPKDNWGSYSLTWPHT